MIVTRGGECRWPGTKIEHFHPSCRWTVDVVNTDFKYVDIDAKVWQHRLVTHF
jgi:hypothetical protein